MGIRYYLAWEVPDHISVPIESLRTTLFRRTGCISLRALFPLVPITCTDGELSSCDLSVPPESAQPAHWNGLTVDASGLFIPCLTPKDMPEVSVPASHADACHLPCSGIFLGSQDCAGLQISELQELFIQAFPKGISFTPKKIIMLSMTYADSGPWWSSLTFTWEIIKSIR